MKCISCGKNLSSTDDYSIFSCPECGKIEIVRCGQCKKKSVQYKCNECGFIGP
ncbi:MAG: DUF1610 domain-containing protein [Candidatus Aenigmarchaeota archaeon]|nr:DUF1610 domain-containing protein [Candidatus Aenigmarchaeota archaeon]